MKRFLVLALMAITMCNVASNASNTTEYYTFIAASDNSVDKMLDSYDAYVTKYISLMKKVQSGDMSAMTEYAQLLQKSQDLQKKIQQCKNQMNQTQLNRYMKITQKLTKAIK